MNSTGKSQQSEIDTETVESGIASLADLPVSVLLSALPQGVLLRMARPLLEKLLALDPPMQLAVAEAIGAALDAAAETGAEQITIDDALAAILRGIFNGFGEQAALAEALAGDGGDVAQALLDSIESVLRQVLRLPVDPDGETADAAEAGGVGESVQRVAQLLDLGELDLEQLMDLDIRGDGTSMFDTLADLPFTPSPDTPRENIAQPALGEALDAVQPTQQGQTSVVQGPNGDLPADLTAIDLAGLMSLSLVSTSNRVFAEESLLDVKPGAELTTLAGVRSPAADYKVLPDDLTVMSLPVLMTVPLSGGGSVVRELPTQVAALARSEAVDGTFMPSVVSGASFAAYDPGAPVSGLSPTSNGTSAVNPVGQNAQSANGPSNGNNANANASGPGNSNNANANANVSGAGCPPSYL